MHHIEHHQSYTRSSRSPQIVPCAPAGKHSDFLSDHGDIFRFLAHPTEYLDYLLKVMPDLWLLKSFHLNDKKPPEIDAIAFSYQNRGNSEVQRRRNQIFNHNHTPTGVPSFFN